MRSAHVEAVLSAVVLAEGKRGENDANEYLAKCAASLAEFSYVQRCIEELSSIAKQADKQWRVLPFGSYVSGLALQGSDLDATCCMPESNQEDAGGSSAVSTLKWILPPLLKQHPSFTVTEQIYSARVPIIKLRFENCLDVDLSCHNMQPLENTGLIQAYVQVHPSVRELILAVKMWAKAADVCGGAHGKLSCYTFALMVIYYLQVDPSVNLPCLPTAAFDLTSERPSGKLHPCWSCKLPLPILLARFFMFYAEIFSWGREVVTVRLGRRVDANDSWFSSLSYRSSRRIHIEDPYDLKRNLHCVLGAQEEYALRLALAEASGVVRDESLAKVSLHQHLATAKKKKQVLFDVTLLSRVVEAQPPEAVPSSIMTKPKDTTCHSTMLEKVIAVEEEDFRMWFAFVSSCCLYAFYAVCSGHLFRLAIAVSGLLLILSRLTQQRRMSRERLAALPRAEDASTPSVTSAAKSRTSARRSLKHRNWWKEHRSQPQESKPAEIEGTVED
jgi:hypothetical protein